ncbi:3-deoxy-7-phosphoheptulonate synthase [Labilibaculum manganireducens]|uniref:Phospho-2-dehydro-3-deoxyheptonate aldolase n=1 Tax=Labilibaculum manganireducens TaxID=1940525 RepID=A0A2N3IDP3_9BACT|nr:3-deoxy-7-phosphoheptulonate synthase [Labilibaculum manganireducens]PKQ68426.1 3-deoxy-7-phosphoheptulonate synthase [Labilibaculum manganireducens]
MMDPRIENLNVSAEQSIITPIELKELYPLSEKHIETVNKGQTTIKNILNGSDKRILAIVGPCSIHDIKSAKEYAQKLKVLADDLKEDLFIVMRIYFEKPRTTVGWKGLINDPYLDNSCKIQDGLKQARGLLVYIAELGLPAAGEALDIVTPQYIQDLFSWTAIGARTTESQSHRNMSSGLSSVVGFKNGTDGNIDIAINAMQAVASPHNFVSINPEGKVAVIRTLGNPNTHIILRGGKKPNFEAEHIAAIEKKLSDLQIVPRIMVDCSHANSSKKAQKQEIVLASLAGQIAGGNKSIMGFMVESNLMFGKQSIPDDQSELKYGVSVTDECLDFESTERILREFCRKIK